MSARLTAFDDLPDAIRKPGFERRGRGAGIVHLGVGAFHRAHQAVYTDDALARSGGDWMIIGVSLRSCDVAEALNPQAGLYTVLVRGGEKISARVVGSIAKVLAVPREPAAVLDALAAPSTRIVSLTVTEKGYGFDPATGALDRSRPDIAADLAEPDRPRSVVGHLVAAFAQRRARGAPGLTVLSCDNLPGNGELVRRLVLDFAREVDRDLACWIAETARFPSTMVDRITPATSDETLAEAERATGRVDMAAVETEAFSQWVIEDDFAAGRPDWEAGGALFVASVAPYEKMKLRMLNGAHSMIAYAGFLAGHEHVRDVMAHEAMRLLVERHLRDAARTLDPVKGIALPDYAARLMERFANPAIAHRTEQIAIDGTQKLPQRVFEPALAAFEAGWSLDSYAFATAMWIRFVLGRTEDGRAYTLHDPRAAALAAATDGHGDDAGALANAVFGLDGLMPARLAQARAFRDAVETRLARILKDGVAAAITREAMPCRV
ncbi:mannitol dehydrogenase family protein [Nitratireductor sp. StC3]|uniref:mannitol dehydrogenase family protein n=1 Tax=Nitratireductor sp. StC3 TaxID=2126741 RepID=UPI000D0CB342|nr:mannitol dehydrogenase family protein [Nitratireductor sp. StC3]PSM17581.1 mannitol dehydrogenase family protein [Nitratireductor sp. StC3]